MKAFACGSVVPGCTARFTAPDVDGILAQVSVHAREDHEMETVPPDVVAWVRENVVQV